MGNDILFWVILLVVNFWSVLHHYKEEVYWLCCFNAFAGGICITEIVRLTQLIPG